MGLKLTDLGHGKLVYSIQAAAYIDRETVEGLTTEQLARLEHHVTEVSRRVFAASVAGMVKGRAEVPFRARAEGPGRVLARHQRGGRRSGILAPAHIQRGGGLRQPNRTICRRPGGGTVPGRQLTLDEARTDGLVEARCYRLQSQPVGE